MAHVSKRTNRPGYVARGAGVASLRTLWGHVMRPLLGELNERPEKRQWLI